MSKSYDFIIVGAGNTGAILARRLASFPSRPQVALFESGAKQEGHHLRLTYNRFNLAFSEPDLDYGYTTVPQNEFGNRAIPIFRGRGLGGTTQTNFQLWSLGARDEFDAWAARVDDDDWNFNSFLESIKNIEKLNIDLPEKWSKYVQPTEGAHGFSGDVEVSIGGTVEPEAEYIIEAGLETGYKLNLDQNDGDPIGIGLTPATSKRGIRTTSASAYLDCRVPSNLTIFENAQIEKVIIDDHKAIGVMTIEGKEVHAMKEVIICAGAIDSVKLLLLSGVGPREDLELLGIEVMADLPVGRNLIDHPCVPITYHMVNDFTKRLELSDDPVALEKAVKSFEDGQGPLMQHYSTTPTAFLRSETIFQSHEFRSLSTSVQTHLKKATVPSFEFAIAGPLIPAEHKFFDADDSYLNFFVTVMNVQSRGYITLSSKDPRAKPLINPRYLEHEYDKFVMKTAIEEALRWLEAPSLRQFTKNPLLGPATSHYEDIEAHIRETGMGLFHPSCTIKMGPKIDASACLDSNLKVRGLNNLRVADLSIPPELPSGHPQILAYAIGYIAAEKMKREWGL